MAKINSEQNILKARARMLSQVTIETRESQDQLQSMVGFYLTPQQYCFESVLLKEVLILKDMTTIPGVPSFVQGIINIRGQVMSLMNLRKFLGIMESGITEQNKIMIVSHKGLEIGILVDRISGMFSISGNNIDPALPHFGDQGEEFVKGVTRDGIIVLDFRAMLESRKIIVQDIKN